MCGIKNHITPHSFSVQVLGSFLVIGYRLSVLDSWILVIGYWLSVIGSWLSVIGSRFLVISYRLLVIGWALYIEPPFTGIGVKGLLIPA